MDWQKELLGKLDFNAKQCFIISDPEHLCFEPLIAERFEQAEVELVDDSDPISLRFIYESRLEKNNNKALIITCAEIEDNYIPFDITFNATNINFHINEIIPELEVETLRSISPVYFQPLKEAISSYRPGKLGRIASLDFLLRHIFKIAPEIIQTEVDLVRLLIQKHYLGGEMPEAIEQRLIALLKLNDTFNGWDFDRLLPSKAEFFEFLQVQWTLYLETLVSVDELKEPPWPQGKLIVPFDDQDVQVYVDNLFADGLLKPVNMEGISKNHWAVIGIISEDGTSQLKRFSHLLARLNSVFLQELVNDLSADIWGEHAFELGMLNALGHQIKTLSASEITSLNHLNTKVDHLFEEWLFEKFGGLISLPAIRHPNMLHKIPDWLNRKVQDDKKICLLVMDGMGFQQWSLFRESLNSCSRITMEEHYSFAWVPTITSISRQSMFSGKKPYFYADSLLTTSKESKLWQAYWENNGLTSKEVLYAKKVEDRATNESFSDLISNRHIKALGLVINFVDEQMHGMKAGMSGLNAVVSDWIVTWKFEEKINILIDLGYEVIITADHGNQEAIGCGALREGVKAETKGERVRIYDSENAATSSNDLLDGKVLKWPGKKYGLPEGRFPLVSRGTHAFVKEGKKIVGHGGISLHEVVVPLAVIKRKL
ncbi:BREX-3 system phosphatase PglZ [Colwellia sp. MSW7]|uniref:BREX-3 system phosphatase PglZ n=1 Tax=Colwellia maritima TaxID=2912588 RepID=A0ABS9X4I3_9GAMM|nr:BREX-3 system phosphatase PglZ [Colwellia maritima]MCI2285142.1 BREX-3 system phosphatase PglZ [Colwellia maritima]